MEKQNVSRLGNIITKKLLHIYGKLSDVYGILFSSLLTYDGYDVQRVGVNRAE